MYDVRETEEGKDKRAFLGQMSISTLEAASGLNESSFLLSEKLERQEY